jgi:hypothetical protein
MGELLEVLEQLRSDSAAMQSVVSDLAELKRKLPAELLSEPEAPRLSDAAWLHTLLPDIQPLLLELLLPSDGNDPRSRSEK